jgi:hypothetical protein
MWGFLVIKIVLRVWILVTHDSLGLGETGLVCNSTWCSIFLHNIPSTVRTTMREISLSSEIR